MSQVVYVTPQECEVDQFTQAQVIALKRGEIGYWPVRTNVQPNDLNEQPLTPEECKSAVWASMFGWDTPAAEPINQYFQRIKQEVSN